MKFKDSQRDAHLLEAAKAMCDLCNIETPLYEDGGALCVELRFIHNDTPQGRLSRHCKATQIHALRKKYGVIK